MHLLQIQIIIKTWKKYQPLASVSPPCLRCILDDEQDWDQDNPNKNYILHRRHFLIAEMPCYVLDCFAWVDYLYVGLACHVCFLLCTSSCACVNLMQGTGMKLHAF
jgi:hypothetical protein